MEGERFRWRATERAQDGRCTRGGGIAAGVWAQNWPGLTPQGCMRHDHTSQGGRERLVSRDPSPLRRETSMCGGEVICAAPAFSSRQKDWLLCLFCRRSQAPTCNVFPNTWPEITEEFALCPNFAGSARRSSFCPSPSPLAEPSHHHGWVLPPFPLGPSRSSPKCPGTEGRVKVTVP